MQYHIILSPYCSGGYRFLFFFFGGGVGGVLKFFSITLVRNIYKKIHTIVNLIYYIINYNVGTISVNQKKQTFFSKT